MKSQEVEIYYRTKSEAQTVIPIADEEIPPASKGMDENAEREALVKEHVELFDTKPTANIGIDKLREKIAAKKAEQSENEETAL